MDIVNWLETPRSGVLLALASSFLVSACSVGVKVTTNIPVGQITFTTHIFLLIISVILSLNTKETLFPRKDLFLLLGTTLFSLPLLIFSYKAVRFLPLSDEALIAYTSIIFTIVLGKIWLGESLSKEKLISSAGILFGVFLVTVGPDPRNNNYLNGCILSLLSALSDAISYIIIKKLTHLHYSVILLNYSILSVIVTANFYWIENWTWDNNSPLLLLSVLGSIQELLVTLALTTEQAGLVCMLHASDVIFSYAWELCLFDEIYTVTKVCGAVLVTLSVIFSAYLPRDETTSKSAEDKEKEIPLV